MPVLRGADQPLVKELLPGRIANPSSAASCTDENGNVISVHPARFALPEPRSKALAKNFVSWYIDTIQQSSTKVNIVCVGPLTNLALVLRAEPSLIQNIEEIVIMGGCHAVSNRSAAAEFNIWKDPEAAEIVLTSKAKITLVPLDATHAAATYLQEAHYYDEMHHSLGDFVAELIRQRTAAYNLIAPLDKKDLCPIHDALAVAYLIDPKILKNIIHTRVDVDFSGGFADGRTIIDFRSIHDLADNCYVALDADRDRFNQLLIQRLSLFPHHLKRYHLK